MSGASVLDALTRQSRAMGLEAATLSAIVEEASETGARRALASLGLEDKAARRDMDELRDLLSAWRSAKRSAGAAIVSWLSKMLLAALLLGVAIKARLLPGVGQ